MRANEGQISDLQAYRNTLAALLRPLTRTHKSECLHDFHDWEALLLFSDPDNQKELERCKRCGLGRWHNHNTDTYDRASFHETEIVIQEAIPKAEEKIASIVSEYQAQIDHWREEPSSPSSWRCKYRNQHDWETVSILNPEFQDYKLERCKHCGLGRWFHGKSGKRLAIMTSEEVKAIVQDACRRLEMEVAGVVDPNLGEKVIEHIDRESEEFVQEKLLFVV